MAHPSSLRKYPRRQFEKDVGILLNGKFQITRALQVGEGGMMVMGSDSTPVGSLMIITFALPGEILLAVRAQVLYQVSVAEGTALGLQFHNLPFEHKRAIRHFIALRTEPETVAVTGSDRSLGSRIKNTAN